MSLRATLQLVCLALVFWECEGCDAGPETAETGACCTDCGQCPLGSDIDSDCCSGYRCAAEGCDAGPETAETGACCTDCGQCPSGSDIDSDCCSGYRCAAEDNGEQHQTDPDFTADCQAALDAHKELHGDCGEACGDEEPTCDTIDEMLNGCAADCPQCAKDQVRAQLCGGNDSCGKNVCGAGTKWNGSQCEAYYRGCMDECHNADAGWNCEHQPSCGGHEQHQTPLDFTADCQAALDAQEAESGDCGEACGDEEPTCDTIDEMINGCAADCPQCAKDQMRAHLCGGNDGANGDANGDAEAPLDPNASR